MHDTASQHYHEQPIVMVDVVVFTLIDNRLHLMLTRRDREPELGRRALPGVWIHTNEDTDLEATALRGLQEKTGVQAPYFEQVHTFGSQYRDVRRWSVSVCYMALLSWEEVQNARPGRDTSEILWVPVDEIDVTLTQPHPDALAFDHAKMIIKALARLRNKVSYSSLPAHLLPKRFTKTQLQSVYEAVLGVKLDKSAFRKKLDEADFLLETTEEQKGRHRPAMLYELRDEDDLVMFRRTLVE